MNTMIAVNIAIWVLMLLLLALTKLDYGAVAMIITVLLVLTKCVEPGAALAKFADSNVIIIASMMMAVAGFSKTKAVKNIGDLLFKVSGGSFERCCRMFMVVLFIMGFLMSGAITRIAIAYPLILQVCERNGKSPSKAMFPLGVMMLCDQTGIPIGGGAVVFNRYNGFLEAAGYTYGDKFSIFEPFIARLPVCIIMLLFFMFFGLKMAPDTPPVDISGISARTRKVRELTPFQEKAAYTIFAAMSIMLVVCSYINLPQWIVTVTGAILMYVVGANNVRESVDAIPFSLMMLLIGAFVMSEALLKTGTGAWVGNLIAGALGGHPSTLVLYLVFWVVVVVLTQFMNNGATANLFIPIAIMTANTIGCSAKGLILIIQNASLVAWFMPTATAIIPMLMEGGGYDIKSLLKQGWAPALVKTVAQVGWIALMFPAYR